MTREEKDRRRGLIATIIYHVLLVLAFVFLGLTYQDPPPEDGIAINFGYEDDGSGNTTQSIPEPTQPQQEQVEETAEEIDDEVVTQEAEEAPSVTNEKTEPKKENPKEEPKEPEKVVDPRLRGATEKTSNSQDVGQGEGEGETEGGGDQGDRNGDPNSPNRDGNGGIGNSGDYRLGTRKALQKPKPDYDCDAQGRVVVKVKVDRTGKTISAEPGVNIPNGPKSQTGDPCLLSRAKKAALKTTWQGDASATDWQVGYIIYNFSKR